MPTYIAIIVVIFVLDWATKALVRLKMPLGSEISLLPIFSLVHTTNTGVAFGLFQGWNFLFLLIGIGVCGGLLYWGAKTLKEDKQLAFILALVIGGALGNLFDRAVFGRVTDFLDFYWSSYHWPAFNVADSSICIGAALLLLTNFRSAKKQKDSN